MKDPEPARIIISAKYSIRVAIPKMSLYLMDGSLRGETPFK